MLKKVVALIRTMRPMTWVSIIITILAGMMISFQGMPPFQDMVSVAVVLPILVLGYANTLNAYTDYKIDEITRPYRAIPSGVLQRRTVLYFAVVLLMGSIIAPFFILDCVLCLFVFIGLILSTVYSLGPTRVKTRGPVAPLAIAAGYVFIPLMGASSIYSPPTFSAFFIAIVLTLQTAGASLIKDFVDLPGDRALNVKTLPLTIGVEKARLIILSGLAVPLIVFPLSALARFLPLLFLSYLVFFPWWAYIAHLSRKEATYEKAYINSFFFCAVCILLSGIAYTGGML